MRLRGRGCGPSPQTPDDPNDEHREQAEDDERCGKNWNDPAGTAERSDIPTYRGGCVSMHPASEYGDVATDSGFPLQANAAAEGGGVTADLALIFNFDAPA